MDGRALLAASVRFGRALHAAGLATDLPAAVDFARAITLVDVTDRTLVHAAGRAIFVRRADELPTYDRVFEAFWHNARSDGAAAASPPGPSRAAAGPAEADGAADAEGAADPALLLRYSRVEQLRQRSFEQMTAAELGEAQRLIERLRFSVPLRRTRRYERRGHGRLLAPRTMLRRNLHNGGEPLDWVWRRATYRPRPIVVLCDISGSMDAHARLLLRFVHVLAQGPAPVEAFVFGTRLTRITPLLRGRDADRALARVAEVVADWSGGTRIGEAFREFNRRWSRRLPAARSLVVVVSDGWDRGDPELVRTETARLARNCHRLIWLNPLAATDGYRPLTAGMAAALPFIDRFLPVASVVHLEQLGSLLAGDGLRRVG